MNPYAAFRLTILVMIVACTGAVAQKPADEPRSPEAKAAAFSSILRTYRFLPPMARSGEEKLCPAIFEALRSRTGVKIIKPEFVTNDEDDPRLAKYRSCRNFDAWPPGVGNSDVAFHDLYTAGDRNYALYRLDGGELLYAEISRERQELNESGGYIAVDLQKCMIDDGVSIQQVDVESAFLTDVNALLIFRGDYFIADLFDSWGLGRQRLDQKPLYGLDISRRKQDGRFQSACGWVQKPDGE